MCKDVANQEELDLALYNLAYRGECVHITTAEPLIIEHAPPGLTIGNVVSGAQVDVHGGTVIVEIRDRSSDGVVRVFDETKVQFRTGIVHAFEHTDIVAEGDYGHGRIVASPYVLIRKERRSKATIEGGMVREDKRWGGWGAPAEEWLARWRLIPDAEGVVVVYKGVYSSFMSDHYFDYSPGSTPTVGNDWDPITACGYGLHFSPTPFLTRRYTNGRTTLGCPVRVDEIVTLGDKIKAKRVVAPGCFLVDIHGRPINADGALVAT